MELVCALALQRDTVAANGRWGATSVALTWQPAVLPAKGAGSAGQSEHDKAMDYRQIVYFRAVARCGTISAAAAQLRIAQPAISAQILNLERELGAALFERHPRGVTLTREGEVFLNHADRIVEEFAAARQAVSDLSGEVSGPVRIGLPTTIANVLAAPIIDSIGQHYPWVEPHIVEALSGEIANWNAEGRFDVAILYADRPGSCANTTPLMVEDLCVFGRKATLEHYGSEMDFSELGSFGIYHTSTMHACRNALSTAAASRGIPLRVVAEVDSIARLNEMALRGGGVTVFPPASIAPEALAVGHACRIVSPSISLVSALSVCTTGAQSRASRAVAQLICEVAQSTLALGAWAGARFPGQDRQDVHTGYRDAASLRLN